MRLDYISRSASDLKRESSDSDPFHIVKEMGIILLFQAMGKARDACKGFFLSQDGQRCITINSDRPGPPEDHLRARAGMRPAHARSRGSGV